MNVTNCRWKDKDGNHQYDSFIPEVERPLNTDGTDSPDPQPGEKRKRQPRRPTDKGALYYMYSRDVHEWVTHLRRIHFNNPTATISGKTVMATNPLAPPGEGLYYVHSRTAYYNSFFLEFWDECFVRTFGLVCPFYEFQSMKDLENLLDAKIKRYTILIAIIVYNM